MIKDNGATGIIVSRSSAADIVGNMITGNETTGIRIHDNSAARIGFLGGSDARIFMPNTIQSNDRGIAMNRSSEARIASNTISINDSDGITVDGSSFARIGFPDSDVAVGGNTIQNNGSRGIAVRRGSSARIVGNQIISNGIPAMAGDPSFDGIRVEKVSQADIAGNNINGNGSDAIEVRDNSGVNLGTDAGATPSFTDDTNTGAELRKGCQMSSGLICQRCTRRTR